MKNSQKGFTLIELMIVVAIIAILAAIAIPQYQNYAIRAKVSEAIVAADAVKTAVSEGYQTGGTTGLAAAAAAYPASNTSTASKYVSSISVASDTGVITATVAANAANGLPTGLNSNTLIFTPMVNQAGKLTALGSGTTGSIDWACSSSSSVTAQKEGFTVTNGTLPAKYAPSACQ